MSSEASKVVIAAVHASAPPFDLKAGVAKTCALIAEASRRGARLVVFPESFIPGFPVWAGVLRPIDAHSVFRKFAENSLNVNGKEFRDIQATAAKHRIYVSLGFSELSNESKGRLWNSQALISDTGELVNHHRKLVPTFYEQLAWTRGDAAGLRLVNSPFGRIGGLICGENNNPLARYSLMAQGEEIHCACYPAVWPFRNPLTSSAYDLRESIRFRAASYSFEAKTFTVVSAGVLDEETLSGMSCADEEIRQILLACPRACSMIVGPTGELISDILQDTEGMVLAEADTSALTELKRHHDMAGYYNREDIFRVEVKADRPHTLDLIKRSDRASSDAEGSLSFGEDPIVEIAAE